MRAAFFHDHVFSRDAAGVHYSSGSLPNRVLARYVEHFERLVVVGRIRNSGSSTRTIADGNGIEMECLDGGGRWSLLLGLGAARRHIRAVLASVDCAIIRLPSAIGRIACSEAIRAGKPWMVEIVGCTWDALWNHGTFAGKVLAPRSFLVNRRLIRKAPYALYVTHEFLQRRYPCGGESIACSDVAIDPAPRGVVDRRLFRIATGFRGRSATLGLVGSLDVNYKGHDTALRALALLTRKGLDIRLRCLGGGNPSRWRKRAESLGIVDRVEFTGTLVPGAAVLEWMDDLDVYLIPSLQEGLPRALVEAMSRGLPVVGARTGGIPELIGPECIHPRRDHRSLARHIEHLLVRPEVMRSCALTNWETAGKFAADVLDERRSAFLERFRRFAAAPATRSRVVVAGA